MLVVIVLTLALILTSLHPGGDYILWQWKAVVIACGIPTCLKIAKKTSVVFALACFYTVWMMADVVFPLINDFTPAGENYRMVIALYCANGFIAAISVLFAALALPENILTRGLPPALAIYGVVNSIYVIAGAIFGFGKFALGVGISGFLDYSGLNGVLIAACTVCLLDYLKTHAKATDDENTSPFRAWFKPNCDSLK